MKVWLAAVLGFFSVRQLWGCWTDIQARAPILDHVSWFILLWALACSIYSNSITDRSLALSNQINEVKSETISQLKLANEELNEKLKGSMALTDRVLIMLRSLDPFAPPPSRPPRPEDIN